ncbi:MAG TPA: TlyA family RNA methyltransferase [Candidatus Saccharimonadales bacterium]|nr:TlyA family RNA methyltransferase [Candidatus Saccharimonadales bacterium]
MRRKRLDQLLVERGIAESAQKALGMILAGEVLVDGNRQDKAGTQVAESARIELASRSQKYASRGGLKLEGALADFLVSVERKVCLDVGSSTGGFTDCLLQHGAARVYAVDVTVDQMAWKLHEDARVIRIEKNARELRAVDLPEAVDVVAADVSFISVRRVLGPAATAAKAGSEWLILIKPQFELPREDVGPGGIVEDPVLHEKAIAEVRLAAEAAGLDCLAVRASRLTGTEGNQEYFLHARKKQ